MVDPTIDICVVRDSFSACLPLSPSRPISYHFTGTDEAPPLEISLFDEPPTVLLPFICEEAYEELVKVRKSFNTPLFDRHRYVGCPFDDLSKCSKRFGNRAAMKLANIDAIFSLATNHSLSTFLHVDLCGAPGAFVEYIQYRYPLSFTVTLSLSPPKGLPFDLKSIDMSRCITYNGESKSGDIFEEGPSLYSFLSTNPITSLMGGKASLVSADGALGSLKGREDMQERDMLRLIISEVSTAFQVLNEGGSMVVKVFDSVEIATLQFLYLVSQSFDDFWIFKPMSSRPANCEKYVVGKGFRGDNSFIRSVVSLEQLPNDVSLYKLFEEELPDHFISYVTSVTSSLLNQQLKYSKMIEDSINKRINQPTNYNLNRALTSWGLPWMTN